MSGRDKPSWIRKLRLKNILIIAFILAFAVGITLEIWKHSDSRINGILKDNREAFDACAEYFRPSSDIGYKPSQSSEYDSSGQRITDVTSVQYLEELLKDEPVAESIKALDKAGVLRISVDGAEVRFYLDMNMGICYIDGKQTETAPEQYYYPQKYLDDNLIDGSWYRFGEGKKK